MVLYIVQHKYYWYMYFPLQKTLNFTEDVNQPPQLVTEEKIGLLWPQPQHIIQKDGLSFSPKRPSISVFVSAGPMHSMYINNFEHHTCQMVYLAYKYYLRCMLSYKIYARILFVCKTKIETVWRKQLFCYVIQGSPKRILWLSLSDLIDSLKYKLFFNQL